MKNDLAKDKQKLTIFYSWQSDDATTKRYIEKCLKKACRTTKENPLIEFRLEVDDSTKGETGAVDIPATVMKKIDKCDMFVADLSFIGKYGKRKLVNQNVMFELGYAMGKRGVKHVVMLFNEDKGKISDLPFDISHRRVMSFSPERDPDGVDLGMKLAKILLKYNQTIVAQEQVADDIPKLDNEELEIMRLFKSMGETKHIMVMKTLDGDSIYAASEKADQELLSRINQNPQKIIANLDELVEKNILKYYQGGNNTPNYELKKLGYKIIEKM